MAISQKKLIDIKTVVSAADNTGRSFTGLVITSDSMNTVSGLTTIRDNYNRGKVVTISKSEMVKLFDDESDTYEFLEKYFGYIATNGTSPASVSLIREMIFGTWTANKEYVADDYVKNTVSGTTTYYICKTAHTSGSSFDTTEAANWDVIDVPTDTAAKAIASVLDQTIAFGSVAMIGADDSSNASIASALGTDYVLCAGTTSYSDTAEVLANYPCACVVETATGEPSAAWMPMAWIATLNYSTNGGASTMFAKEFGATATVTTDSDYEDRDDAHVNFIGRFQEVGQVKDMFYPGCQINGQDTGTFVNEMYLRGLIASGWFNLISTVEKVPANTHGAAMFLNILSQIASNCVDNGIILIDKTLTDTDKALINSWTNNESDAIDSVQNNGYYTSVTVAKDGTKYVLNYTLVYAKGDHISKVSGTHVLV